MKLPSGSMHNIFKFDSLCFSALPTHFVENDVGSVGTPKKQDESLAKRPEAIRLHENADKAMTLSRHRGEDAS